MVTANGFVEEAKGVLQEVRTSLSDLVASVGADPTQPQDMARRFDLDKTLTWKIGRVICEANALAVVPHIPGRAAVRNFVETLERSGAPAADAASVRKAMDRFDKLIETHSGDRETFEMMLGGVSDDLSRKRGEAFRKMAFQGNSAVWGVSARTHLSIRMVMPGSREGLLNMSTVTGFFDFRRLRADIPWAIAVANRWGVEDDGSSGRSPLQPLGEDPAEREIPLLTRFCSSPLPEMVSERDAKDNMRFVLQGGAAGKTASATILMGWHEPDAVPCHESFPGEIGEHGVHLSTPAETLMFDFYVHRSLGFAMNPTAHIFSQLPGSPRYGESEIGQTELPIPLDVTDLGEPPDLTVPNMPNYRSLVTYSASRQGHAVTDFHAYRLLLKYPPIATIAILKHGLMKR